MNLAILSGNVVKDARLFSSGEGKVCCVSRLAIREDRKPKDKLPTFIDFIIWGQRAEKISSYITKGKAVSMTGRIEINRTVKGEKTYFNTRVVVDTLEFISRKNCNGKEGGDAEERTERILDTNGENS